MQIEVSGNEISCKWFQNPSENDIFRQISLES